MERFGSIPPSRLFTSALSDLGERLDGVDLDVAPAVAGKAVDRVGVADLVEHGGHQRERLFRDVDDTTRGRTFGVAGVGQRLVRRRAHVEQEQRRDVSLFAASRDVETFRRRLSSFAIGLRVDERVEIEVVAVLHAAHFAELLGAHHPELAFDRVDQFARARQSLVEERAAVAADLLPR